MVQHAPFLLNIACILLASTAGGEDEEELDDDAIAGEAAAEDDAAGEVEDEGKACMLEDIPAEAAAQQT